MLERILKRRWFVAIWPYPTPRASVRKYATGLWGLLGPWTLCDLFGPCESREEAVETVDWFNEKEI